MSWLKKIRTRLKALWKKLYWFFEGAYRTGQLEDAASVTRTDAEKAVDRILKASGLPPDCVGATVLRGGPAIVVTHTTTTGVPGWPPRYHSDQEAFIHKTYDQAATKALEWIEKRKGDGNVGSLVVGGSSKYNREQRRAWGAKLKKARNRGSVSE